MDENVKWKHNIISPLTFAKGVKTDSLVLTKYMAFTRIFDKWHDNVDTCAQENGG